MRVGCIDIGGTAIKSGVLENGALTDLASAPTRAAEGGRAVLEQAAQIAAGMQGIGALGVCTCGEVDTDAGAIRLADNIPGYTGLPVREILRQLTGLPVTVENDANAALRRFGPGRWAPAPTSGMPAPPRLWPGQKPPTRPSRTGGPFLRGWPSRR